ncbi:outer membrane protein assembly factor BamA [Acinetobacter qingfengensis]|uniref:Outer membrane protein assembly factor BamA n=1 Tax=Acinetobacter qingfengensis TaxID=1262585 RepID=A0A1E7REL8_9GAMM|nr:outer membrane protein assembly factor BamA [Acinetobacter qingfengensis]KAA8734386.1 outer membrane protein assembly factor BamA [Acinetobacter qingfengensis]OEY97605.1 outer membrane protein assembly factor BamA [Acinetobacter qingfengensis]
MRHNPLFMPLALVSAMAIVQTAHAESFQVSDIRVEGLVRLTPANVYGLIPISAGDQASDASIANAIKALYDSGNFDDVQSYQQGNTLLFKVIERPIIASVELDGNKLIPKEALLDGLKKMGIAEGEVLKKATLQNVENELEQQYSQQGRYNANITVETTPRPNNRVAVKLKFDEGKAAKVVSINVIGNHVFSDKDIERAFAVKESSWSSIVTRNDRYAKEKMSASLEALRAMYLNDGYINFTVNSSQLNLSEDKQHIFIEVNVDEGEKFNFGETKFLGDALFENKDLQALQIYKNGETYSQAKVNALKQQLLRKFGNAGYYFAEVNVVPEINAETKTVNLNYYINPGQKVTVRRINFSGNSKTNDAVLRREMRQMEGALASNEKIDLSKVRLERTGYFKTVDIKPVRVPSSPDQVDLDVKVEEQHSGTSTIAVGYSQSYGVTYQLGLSQNNFMGTGNKFNIDLSRSSYYDSYNIGVYDPYWTIDGVSRGYNVYYRKTKLDDDYNVSNYYTDSIGANVTFGYPLDENQSISATVGVDKTKVTTGPYASSLVVDYLRDHGTNRKESTGSWCPSANYDTDSDSDGTNDSCSDAALVTYPDGVSSEFLSYNLSLAWAYNSLNRPMFPTKGFYNKVNLDIALPGSDQEYQKITYDAQAYFPIGKGFVVHGYGKLGYGNDLPFFKNFFAGGWGSVRGYESNTLGPRYDSYYYTNAGQSDSDPEETGGNALIQGGVELVLPLPSKSDWASQVRPVIFAEGGQVFDTKSADYDIDMSELRYSVGVGFTWNTMIGPLSLSYAYPLNKKDGDDTQSVQFQIGTTF